MGSKLFWKVRRIYLNCQFLWRKTIFQFNHKTSKRKRTKSLAFLLFRMVLLQIAKSLLLASVLFSGDFILLPIFESKVLSGNLPNLQLDIATNVVLGGMGVAGVILGLYCSNITSIYSTKYANAPTHLAVIFQSIFH